MTTSWVGDRFDELKGKADKAFLDDTKKTIKDLQTLLEGGAPRGPVDFEQAKATFRKGIDLTTPDGGDPQAAAPPNDARGGGPLLSSTVRLDKRIEFIHYGQVHRDALKKFGCDAPLDDTDASLDLTQVQGGRAVAFRAALQRETLLLACFAQAVEAALDEKDAKEGKTQDLLDVAADLVGGAATKTKDTAVAADMKPFIVKLDAIWADLDQDPITYTGLHTAGMKLHKLRANLLSYMFGLIDPTKKPPPANTAGVLSDLPLIGKISLPGALGEVVGFLQKITGKIFDVQMKLCFGLILAMHEAIESASGALGLESIQQRRPAIYPVWYRPPQQTASPPGLPPLAALQNPVSTEGNLMNFGPIKDAKDTVGTAVDGLNQDIDDNTKEEMKAIDFLSHEVHPAPGDPFLALAFQASLGRHEGLPLFQGSEALGDLAVTTVCTSIVSDVPEIMKGPVGEVAKEVFRVCVEFLRGVYAVLLTYPKVEIDTAALLAAGRKYILAGLLDVATEKLGLDKLIEDHPFPIPDVPFLPTGINWPKGTPLSLQPVLAKVKDVLADKLEPYLAPVIDYATSGLATRLTGARAWAGQDSLTMEIHLGQLPVEIAILFRHLFGPLWGLVTDTLMGALSDAVAEILGPAASAVGYARDVVGKVDGIIHTVETQAQHARDYAAKVEDRAKDLIHKASSVSASLTDQSQLDAIGQAARALQNAVNADILGPGPAAAQNAAVAAFLKVPMFDPKTRKKKGTGQKIAPAELAAVSIDNQWDQAQPVTPSGDAAGGGK